VAVDVCVVGSANLDLVAGTDRLPGPGETVLGHDYAEHPGGKGLNQAVAAARSGARTAFVGALGRDDAGDRLAAVLAAERIGADAMVRVGAPTGRAMIIVDRAGENSIVVVPGANALLTSESVILEASVVLAQLEVPIDTVTAALRRGRERGAVTVLNPAPAAPLPDRLLAACDVIVPNEHELARLGGSAALLDAGCGAVVTTMGSDGAEITTTAGRSHVAAMAVDTVDTTGAGDAFCGSLAARLAAGDELAAAVRWATAAGALATTVHGAVPAQPTAAAIRALLDG
jgi:ribokinase